MIFLSIVNIKVILIYLPVVNMKLILILFYSNLPGYCEHEIDFDFIYYDIFSDFNLFRFSLSIVIKT